MTHGLREVLWLFAVLPKYCHNALNKDPILPSTSLPIYYSLSSNRIVLSY